MNANAQGRLDNRFLASMFGLCMAQEAFFTAGSALKVQQHATDLEPKTLDDGVAAKAALAYATAAAIATEKAYDTALIAWEETRAIFVQDFKKTEVPLRRAYQLASLDQLVCEWIRVALDTVSGCDMWGHTHRYERLLTDAEKAYRDGGAEEAEVLTAHTEVLTVFQRHSITYRQGKIYRGEYVFGQPPKQ